MVSEIPTFTSQKVSGIPSMGIVSMSGDRAMGQAMTNVSGFFDNIAEYNNKKLDDKMRRETTVMAQDAVRSGGLNPNDLDDPYTLADQIYREASLNTYAIQVETDIDKSLNQFEIDSKYNAKGYEVKATAFLDGIMSELAPEMRDSVEKYTMGKIVATSSSLAQETQRKALAESAAASSAYREKLVTEMVNAAPEERASIYVKIEASVAGDPSTITADGKRALLDGIQIKYSKQIGLRDAMTGDRTIPEILEGWKSQGVMITPSLKQQLYSSSQVEYNYQQTIYNKGVALRDQKLKQIQDAFYETLYENQDISTTEVTDIIAETQAIMVEHGADPKKVFEFEGKALKSFMGANKDNGDAITFIDMNIDDVNPNTPLLIKQAVREGHISIATAREKENDFKLKSSEVYKNPQMKQYIATVLQKKYPNAQDFTGISPSDYNQSATDRERRANAVRDQRLLREEINEITQKVNDPENPTSLSRVLAEKSGAESQIEGREIMVSDIGNIPEALEIKSNLNSKQPAVEVFIGDAVNSEKRQFMTYDDIDKLGDSDEQKYVKDVITRWGDGKWDDDNKIQRVEILMSLKDNDDRSIYTDEYIKGVINALGITLKDIEGGR